MTHSEHVSKSELIELLNSDGESQRAHAIGQHLQKCPACRKALDTLAAQSELWAKTPLMLNGAKPTRREHTSAPHERQFRLEDILTPPQHPDMIGRLSRYDIVREIGRGTLGIVFKAYDAEFNRPVAIKILAPHFAEQGAARKRFAQEAIAIAGVLHPSVIAIHDVNDNGKTPFIVMPYISGPTLQDLIDRQGPLEEIEIVRIALQITSGLSAAHAQGLVHCDIKPANVLVEAGVNRVLLTDFGLARALEDASPPRSGSLARTPNYLSPEQTRGERPDQRSDLFSLGSLMYFMATGRLPFRSESPYGVLSRIRSDEPTPVREVNGSISQTVAAVIVRLMRKCPSERFQNAADLHRDLEQHLKNLHQPVDARAPTAGHVKLAGAPWSSRSFFLALAAASVVCMALGYAVGILPSFSQSNSRAFVTLSGRSGWPGLSMRPSEFMRPSEPGTSFDKLRSTEMGVWVDEVPGSSKARSSFNEPLRAGKSTGHEESRANSDYSIACVLAAEGNIDKAVIALERAVKSGFNDLTKFRSDQDLEPIRGNTRFKELLNKLAQEKTVESFLSKAQYAASVGQYSLSERMCRQALALDPNNPRIATNLGYALHMQGELERALPWHRKAAHSQHFGAIGNYNLACVYSLKRDAETAFEYLETAVAGGLADFLDVRDLSRDPDLAYVRADQRFEQLIERLTAMKQAHEVVQSAWNQRLIAHAVSHDISTLRLSLL